MKVRLWKLGSLEYQVVPTKASIKKLEAAVKEATKDEKDVINFVWGPDLEIQEFSADFSTVAKLRSCVGIREVSPKQAEAINEMYTEEE